MMEMFLGAIDQMIPDCFDDRVLKVTNNNTKVISEKLFDQTDLNEFSLGRLFSHKELVVEVCRCLGFR